jgi:hypothetical protein
MPGSVRSIRGTHLTGLKVTGSPRYLNIHSPDYIGPLGATQLALGDGAVWALAGYARPFGLATVTGAQLRQTCAMNLLQAGKLRRSTWNATSMDAERRRARSTPA